MLSRRAERLAAATGAAAIAAYTLYRFREALLTFWVLDDFWVMRDAHRVEIHSVTDLQQFFWFSRQGFRLYRPFTTTAYSYLLQSLFGFDATGHHAFQLLVFTFTVLLVIAIASRLTGSALAGLAVGLLYLLAPGQAVNAYWLSAFTVLGTTVWVLLMLWCWLALHGWLRAVLCTVLQVCGLLASEHAVVAPLLCVIIAWMRREPLRQTALTIAPPAVVAGIYAVAKLLYLRTAPRVGVTYSVNFIPTAMLTDLGKYFGACFNVIAVQNFAPTAAAVIGSALIVALIVAVWRGTRGSGAARLLGGGLALFVIALVPVLVLQGHYFAHYICTAALGMMIAVVGLTQLVTARWRWVVVGLSVLLLVYDVETDGNAWRSPRVFNLVSKGTMASAAWVDAALQAQREHPEPVEFYIPIQTVANHVFAIGEAHTYFPGMPAHFTWYKYEKIFHPSPSQVVVLPRRVFRLGNPLPFWNPRWDWLRRFAATGRDTAVEIRDFALHRIDQGET